MTSNRTERIVLTTANTLALLCAEFTYGVTGTLNPDISIEKHIKEVNKHDKSKP